MGIRAWVPDAGDGADGSRTGGKCQAMVTSVDETSESLLSDCSVQGDGRSCVRSLYPWTADGQMCIRDSFLNVPDILILFMFFSFLFEPAFEFWKTDQRFAYKYKMLCFFMILVMVFAPALSVAGIFLFPGNKVAARIIGANVVTLVPVSYTHLEDELI